MTVYKLVTTKNVDGITVRAVKNNKGGTLIDWCSAADRPWRHPDPTKEKKSIISERAARAPRRRY